MRPIITRYLITRGEEDGPLLTTPLGGVQVYTEYGEAVRAAKNGPIGEHRWIHHTMPLAVYSGERLKLELIEATG